MFSPALESIRSSPENPSTDFSSWLDMAEQAYGTGSGMAISNESALRQVAVLACVRLLAETLAAQPLQVFRRTSSGGKEIANDHDVYSVIHDQWNEFQTSFVGREMMQSQCVLRGNTYAVIERDGSGYLRGLWPVPANCIEPIKDSGRLWYRITQDGTQWLGIKPGIYAPADILHIPGFGFDGIKGYNPIVLAREAVGLGAAAEQFGARFYGNGARAAGILSPDAILSKEQAVALKKSWDEIHTGVYNSHRTALLSHGMKYQALSVNPDEAQFLDTRRYQLAEIARLFRIPPPMIGAPTGDAHTYANHEQRMLDFAMMSQRPNNVRWEQELNRKLFTPREQGRYFCEFNMDSLLRADVKTRYDTYAIGYGRWLTRNEIRALENRNPVDNGDEFAPMQTTPLPVAPPDSSLPIGAKA